MLLDVNALGTRFDGGCSRQGKRRRCNGDNERDGLYL